MKVDMFEKWYTKNHKDIIESCWISEDTKNMYRGMLKKAYMDGVQTGMSVKRKPTKKVIKNNCCSK